MSHVHIAQFEYFSRVYLDAHLNLIILVSSQEEHAMADPPSIAAGVVGLLAFAGSTLTKGYSILRSLQDSKNDWKLNKKA